MDDLAKRALIERYLDGGLTDGDQAEIDALRGHDPAFRDALDAAGALQKTMDLAAEPAFRPGFEGRLMARLSGIEARRGVSVGDLIGRLFPRVAIPAGAAAALFMAGNLSAAAADTPMVEAMFGLPDLVPDLRILLIEASS